MRDEDDEHGLSSSMQGFLIGLAAVVFVAILAFVIVFMVLK